MDITELSDLELINKTLSGEVEFFNEIVKRYEPKIFNYCLRLLNFNRQDAEDVTSETFFKAYKELASFKKHLKFSSWLYRIAHNSAVNLIRKNSHFFVVDIENFWHLPTKSEESEPIETPDLERILNELSPTDKSLLILFHIEEKSLKEIGEIFKLEPNTVAVKLKRARARAKKIINNKSI